MRRFRASSSPACSAASVHQVAHLRVRRLHVDRQFFVAQHFAGRRADRRDDDVAEAGAQFVGQAQVVGQLQQIEHLVARGEHGHVDLAGRDAADVLLQRPAIFRQRPVVHVDRVDRRAAGFQAGDQAAVRDAVLLQAHDQIRHRQLFVERRQQLAPGVRLGHGDRRRDAEFSAARPAAWGRGRRT